jgi:hypothetical protein
MDFLIIIVYCLYSLYRYIIHKCLYYKLLYRRGFSYSLIELKQYSDILYTRIG